MWTLKMANGKARSFATLAGALIYCTMSWDAVGFAPVIVDIDGNWIEYHFNARGMAEADAHTTALANSSLNDYFARQAM